MAGVDPRLALRCYPCYLGRAPAPAPVRRSNRLAAKPRVSYYDPGIPSEAVIRQRDQAKEERATQRAQDRMVLKALRVKAQCEMALARQQDVMHRRVKSIMARLERDEATLATMPATPPRLQRHNAVTGEASWAPPHNCRSRCDAVFAPTPALSHTEATGCAEPNWIHFEPSTLLPPPPLRRVCASPNCDEDCRRCRFNDRLAEFNRCRPLPSPPLPPHLPSVLAPLGLAPPPVGAAVIRVPIDMAQMTAAALQELIAAAQRALANK